MLFNYFQILQEDLFAIVFFFFIFVDFVVFLLEALGNEIFNRFIKLQTLKASRSGEAKTALIETIKRRNRFIFLVFRK
jgi:hypothetical protein